MKKFLVLAAILGLTSFSNNANAATIWNYNDNWNYYQASGTEYTWGLGSSSNDTPSGDFLTANLASFDWSKATSVAQAAFGDYYLDPTVHTNWTPGTGLALSKVFNLSGPISNAIFSYGMDNGLIVYINGTEVLRNSEAGYGNQDEHTLNLNSSIFHTGLNTIQILAEDNGGDSYFDAKLEGDVTPTPEPSSMILGLMSISSLLGLRKKNK